MPLRGRTRYGAQAPEGKAHPVADENEAQAAFDNFVALGTTGTTAGRRAPMLRRPNEVGLDYGDVTFPSTWCGRSR